ncbi:hypothetical protein C8R45DRAFT_960250 [Mycena sanguinolenta]|nr:hypothetical protein C8R45DRAFT_960250 [Mycena sanguinolenta]
MSSLPNLSCRSEKTTMGRWTEHEEDSSRLPEGIRRIGYDDQTARYRFCDVDGNIYVGPAHEEYGKLTPVDDLPNERPHAFACSEERPFDSSAGLTFQDLLPAHLVTSPTSSESSSSGSPSGFRSVHNVVRSSSTFVRKLRGREKSSKLKTI